ncbi:hypothetical protein EMCRGX_G003358 [Ephydatia muelleri]
MAKIDLKAAFHMVPIVAEEWNLLGLLWKGKSWPPTDAADLIHYLDDFLLAGPPGQPTCSESTETMLRVCERLGIPVALDKLEDKLQEMTLLIKSWLGKHRTTVLSLIGKLSFAAKVAPSGRLFLHRLIELSTTVSKLHHHIHLNVEAREDIIWWYRFLPSWNGVSIILDLNWKAINLFTGASGALGYGAYFNGAWFRGDWLPHQKPPMQSIQWQEFFAIIAAACTWGHLLQGQ